MAPIVPAAELWTWLRNSLRPSPAFLHFLLTHGRWFWEFVNATFIRDMLMRLVLTGGWRVASPPTPVLGSRKSFQLLEFLASDKGSGLGDYDAGLNKSNPRGGREGSVTGDGNPLITIFSLCSAFQPYPQPSHLQHSA